MEFWQGKLIKSYSFHYPKINQYDKDPGSNKQFGSVAIKSIKYIRGLNNQSIYYYMLYIKWRSANQIQQYFKYWNCIKLSSFGIVGKKAQLALGNTQRSWFQLNLNLEISRAASKKNRNDKLWHHIVIDIYICIYNYCWKSPNSNHLYDHGFMDVINKYTNCQAVKKLT